MRSAARSTTDCRKTLVNNSLPASKRGMRSSQPLDGPTRDCRRSPKPSATGSNVSLFTRRPTLTSVSSEQRGGSSSAQTASVPSMRGGAAATTCSVALHDLAALDPDRRLREEPGHLVPEANRALAGTGGGGDAAAAGRGRRSDLEEIGEVRPAAHPQLAADRLGRGVGDRDLLERAAAYEPQATDGDAVGTKARCVGIRQEERGGVVVDRTGLEQRERSSVETNLPPAQEARVSCTRPPIEPGATSPRESENMNVRPSRTAIASGPSSRGARVSPKAVWARDTGRAGSGAVRPPLLRRRRYPSSRR